MTSTRAMHARPGHTYPAGRTNRGGYGSANADPLRHAMTTIPAARVRDTGTRLALCGATVAHRLRPDVAFDPDHDRACTTCARQIRRANG